MVIVYLWVPLGIIGMLLASWTLAKEGDVEAREFTVGYVVLGVLLGPLAFVGGVIWAIVASDCLRYIDAFLSMKLFTWRKVEGNQNGELQ